MRSPDPQAYQIGPSGLCRAFYCATWDIKHTTDNLPSPVLLNLCCRRISVERRLEVWTPFLRIRSPGFITRFKYVSCWSPLELILRAPSCLWISDPFRSAENESIFPQLTLFSVALGLLQSTGEACFERLTHQAVVIYNHKSWSHMWRLD